MHVTAGCHYRVRLSHRRRRWREAFGEMGGARRPESSRRNRPNDHLLRALVVQRLASGTM